MRLSTPYFKAIEDPPKDLPPCIQQILSPFSNPSETLWSYPPWHRCQYSTPVWHRIPHTTEAVLDWSFPQPFAELLINKIESPGRWVEGVLSTNLGNVQNNIWKLMAAVGPVVLSHQQHPVRNLTAFVMACVPSPYAILTGSVYVFQKEGFYDIHCDNCNLTNCITMGEPNRGFLLVHQPPFVMLPVNVTGPWYSNSGLQVRHELSPLLQRPKRFWGLLIAGITVLIAVIASVAASDTALTQSIHTATFVNNLAADVSNALGTQEIIDRKLESHVNALEEVVLILGDQLAALKTACSVRCHAEFSAIC
nr:uncharacterized protein LOC132416166 [Delphinus delphis]XP_059855441.1 uncharacterized protein LOC132416166 [Delphinus delphis]XP_059855442.1 uncharacterized protein LOC132416166 [Delphinus delphis]